MTTPDPGLEEGLLELVQPSMPEDFREMAVGAALSFTGSQEGLQFIMQHPQILDYMLELVSDSNPAVREGVIKIFVNVMADETSVLTLVQLGSSFTRMVNHLLTHSMEDEEGTTTSTAAGDASLFGALSNLTRVAEGAEAVALVLMGAQGLGLVGFMCKLCDLHAKKSPQFLGVCTLLLNLCQVPAVRRGLMEPPHRLLLQLLDIFSVSAYKPVVGTVQNCCFEYDFHEWLLSEEVDLLPKLLYPLAGPEEFEEDEMERLPLDLQFLPDTKQREADPEVRRMLINSVHKLCSTKAGRAYVKEKNAYVILRELHKWETNEENVECIMNVIDILIGEEPQLGMENLHIVDIPPHLEDKFLQE